MARLTDRLQLLADASFTDLMSRRAAQGRQTVSAAVCRAVVWALVQHSDQSGTSYPSIETLARESDSSPRTAKRVIAILREEQVVRVRRRNHGAAAGRKIGAAMEGCTNVYVIDWGTFAELRAGGRLTAQNTGHTGPCPKEQQGPVWPVNTGQPVQEHGPASPETGASVAPKVFSEPPIEPPPAPQGGDGSGAVEDSQQPSTGQPVGLVDEIIAAYPTTHGALPVSDTEAVHRAVAAERERSDGASAVEILDAVRAYAAAVVAGHVRSPLWCRRWMAERGYEPYVRAARASSAAQHAAPCDGVERRRLAELAVVAERDAVERRLAELGAEEFESLRRRAIEAHPSAMARGVWSSSESASASLRIWMVQLLDRERARMQTQEAA